MKRSVMDRIIDTIEAVAALFVGLVAADIFISVVLRRFFSVQIPDAYDFGSMLLGILIFWGIAGASYRGEHITVDLVWSIAPRVVRRIMDVFADLLTLGCLGVFTWMMGVKVVSTYHDNLQTFDLRLPVWIFYCVALVGLAAAILLLAVRTVRLLVRPDDLARAPHAQPLE